MSSQSGKTDALQSEIPDPTTVLLSRLENWTHVVGLLQDYIEMYLSAQKSTTNSLEKAKKVISEAPRFDFADAPVQSSPAPVAGAVSAARVASGASAQSAPSQPSTTETQSSGEGASGIAEAFDELRNRTDLILNKSAEAEQQLRTVVLPHLETLRGDINKHYKGFKGPGLKDKKEVEKAKLVTQKHIELLGQHVSTFGVLPGKSKPDYKTDPYVQHRLALGALSEQIIRENNQADAIVSGQKNFQTLERHILQVIQQAITAFDNVQKGYSAVETESFQGIAEKFNRISVDHEWNQFVQRRGDVLIADDAPRRSLDTVAFVNQDHQTTVPVIDGFLQLKSGKLVKSYSSGYYVLTASNFLHQFKSQDYTQDPSPEFSLYLPDCIVGHAAEPSTAKFKFEVQGKDITKTITTKHTFAFKTNTYDEMIAWHDALTRASGGKEGAILSDDPGSPVETSAFAAPAGAVAASDPAALGSAHSGPVVGPGPEVGDISSGTGSALGGAVFPAGADVTQQQQQQHQQPPPQHQQQYQQHLTGAPVEPAAFSQPAEAHPVEAHPIQEPVLLGSVQPALSVPTGHTSTASLASESLVDQQLAPGTERIHIG